MSESTDIFSAQEIIESVGNGGEKKGVFTDIEVTCETHGITYKTKFNNLIKRPTLCCPKCMEEEAAKEKAEEQRQRQRDFDSALDASEIPLKFKNKTLENFEADSNEKNVVLSVAKNFAANFKQTLATGRNLILYGTTGTGKTHIACGIAIEVMKQGYKAKFTETYDILLSVKETFRKDSTTSESQIVRDLLVPDLLIIDEVGMQYGTDSERIIMSNLINKRYGSVRPTILLSNLNLEEISEYMGNRVIDRMIEDDSAFLNLEWESYRKRNKN